MSPAGGSQAPSAGDTLHKQPLLSRSIISCPGSALPVQVVEWKGGHRKAGSAQAPCERMDEVQVTCSFPNGGRWLVAQGAFQGFLEVLDDDGDPTAGVRLWNVLDCSRACSLTIGVSTDGCADSGQMTVKASLPEAYANVPEESELGVFRQEVWAEGQSISLGDLPCGRYKVETGGGTCKDDISVVVVEGMMDELAIDLVELSWLQLCLVDAATREPVTNALVSTDRADEQIDIDATGCGWVPRPAAAKGGVSIRAFGYAPAWAPAHHRTGDIPREEVELYRLTPTAVRCMVGRDTPCPADARLLVVGSGLSRWNRPCEPRANGEWTCPVTGEEKVQGSYAGQTSEPVPIEAGQQGVVVRLPEMDARACLRWAGDDLSPCRLRIEDLSSSSGGLIKVEARSGESVPLSSKLPDGSRALLQCGSRYWAGPLQVGEAGAASCSTVELGETGEVCIRGGRHCSLTAGAPDERPDLLYGYFELRSCVEGLPAGQWTVACGTGEEDRVGVDVVDGDTVYAVLPGASPSP